MQAGIEFHIGHKSTSPAMGQGNFAGGVIQCLLTCRQKQNAVDGRLIYFIEDHQLSSCAAGAGLINLFHVLSNSVSKLIREKLDKMTSDWESSPNYHPTPTKNHLPSLSPNHFCELLH